MSMRFCLSALVALLVLAVVPAGAQQYPSRPVTIMVPFAAGGGSDLLARLVAQKLEEKLGKPFIIDLVVLQDGRGQSGVTFAGWPSAYPRGEEIRLARIVAGRTAAAVQS